MNTVAIIPGPLCVTTLPGKPLADIAGKPMIQHVCERTAQATLVQRVLVATDDERIAAAVRVFRRNGSHDPADLRSGDGQDRTRCTRTPGYRFDRECPR